MADNIDHLAAQLQVVLSEAFTTWLSPDGWPDEADAALLDTVFSTRARYDSVVRPLVNRWRGWEQNPRTGRLSALLSVDRTALVELIANNQKVPGRSPNRPLKIDAVLEVAERLSSTFDSPDEIRAYVSADVDNAIVFRHKFEKTSGIGRAQSAYFLMLLGISGVKADTLVSSWVQRALGDTALSQEMVEEVVTLAADRLGIDPSSVDHTIWRAESTSRVRSVRRRS